MRSAKPRPWDQVKSRLPAAWCLCCGGGWLCRHDAASHCATVTLSACQPGSMVCLANSPPNPVLVCGLARFVLTKSIPGPEVDARYSRWPCTTFAHPEDSEKLLTKTSPHHLTHPLQAFLPSGTTVHMRICMRKRLSAALHLSTLPGDAQSVEADRLHHILVWHSMHIRYAPPSGSCSHANASLKTL